MKLQIMLLAMVVGLTACGGGGGSGSNADDGANRNNVEIEQLKVIPNVRGLLNTQAVGLVVQSIPSGVVFDQKLTIDSNVSFALGTGKYQFVVKDLPDGYDCSAEISNTQSDRLKNLVIDCESTSRQLDVRIDLGDNFDYSGIVASVSGIVDESPTPPKLPLIEADIREGTTEFNGKTYTSIAPEVTRYEVAGIPSPFDKVDIKPDILAPGVDASSFMADSNGNITISYDKRLVNAENLDKLPLLVVSFSCAVGNKECLLKNSIRVVMTPHQFVSGDWNATVLSEITYQRLSYYLLANYSFEDIALLMNNMAFWLITSVTGSDDDYQNILAWRPSVDASFSTIKKPELLRQLTDELLGISLSGEDLLRYAEEWVNPILAQLEFNSLGVLASDGQYAFVAGRDGIKVIDISMPPQPKVLSELQYSDRTGNHTAIIVSEGDLYTTDFYEGLMLFDVSDPNNPIEKIIFDVFPDSGGATSIARSGKYVLVGNNYGELVIVDVSDKSEPFVVGRADVGSYINSIAVVGNHALVVDKSSRLKVVDFESPSEMKVVAEEELGGWGYFVTVDGAYAYVACSNYQSASFNGMRVINIANPLNPRIIGNIESDGDPISVAVKGRFAYLATLRSGIKVIDVTKKSAPELVANIDFVGHAGDMVMNSSHLYLAGKGIRSLLVIDVSQPKQLVSDAFSASVDGVGYSALQIIDNYAYVASSSTGLNVVDLSDTLRPQIVGKVGAYSPTRVVVSKPYAYIADGLQGLKIVDVNDPFHPTLMASLDTNGDLNGIGSADAIAVSDGSVFLAVREIGLRIINIEQPTNPIITSTLDWDGAYSTCVETWNDYIYVCDPIFGLYIIDANEKSNPQVVGHIRSGAVSVAFKEIAGRDYAFVTDYNLPAGGVASGELKVVDIEDPTSPVLIKEINVSGGGYSILLHGNYAYVGNRQGIYLFDISIPEALRWLGYASTRGFVWSMGIYKDYLLVANSLGIDWLRAIPTQY